MEISAKGTSGQATFDGRFVTISRKGFLARATVGKGEKRIPIKSIAAVQWKQPGAVMNGFIQFTVPGGNEKKSQFGSQTMDAVSDENSVVFTKKQMPAFEELRAAVEEAISAPDPTTTTAPSAADEIRKLAELHAAGILTDDEFAAKKAKLLDL